MFWRDSLNLSAIFTRRNRPLPPLPLEDPDHSSSPSWRPFYLRRLVIACFISAACAIVAALEVLNHISQSQDGLASSVEHLHYIWTYTPTAILTLIGALWARTEFQAKQNAPWRSLQEPEQSDKNLLLDYDNIPLVALWKSLKNHHLIVAGGISCSLLFQLSTLFSTSLLSLQSVHVQRIDVPIQLEDVFDGSHTSFNSTQSEAFDVLNEVLFENMKYPSGTNADFAFQRFNTSSDPRVSVVTAPIRAMGGSLECEHATLEIDQWDVARSNDTWGGNTFAFFSNRFKTPSCTISNTTLDDYTTKGYSNYVGRFFPVTCENSTEADPNRILAFAVQYHRGRMLENHIADPPTFWTKTYELVLDRSVQMFCRPTLSLFNLQATSNMSQSENIPNFKETGKEEPGFKNVTGIAWNISQQVIQGSLPNNAADRPISKHTAFIDKSLLQQAGSIEYPIQLGAWLSGENGDAQNLFKNGVFERVVSAFYRAMAAQVIHSGLVKEGVTHTNGSVIFEDKRVLVMQSPLRVLEVCLILSVLVAIAMIMLGPSDGSISQDPSNILTIANIISHSQTLQRTLRRTGGLPLDELREIFRGKRYFLQNHSKDTSIEVDCKKPSFDTHSHCVSQGGAENCPPVNESFWKPFPSLWARILVFFVIAAAIISLEVLLHVSQKNDGLGESSDDGKMHYLWTTIPSLVMMVIGLLIGSLDSNIRVLAPYARLKEAKGVNLEVLATNFLDALRITYLVRSARTRNFAVLSTTLAALITSFLTIITSGLFSAVEVPRIIATNFTQSTLFTSPNVLNLTNDTPTFILADYILNDNLTYPQWTYENLVFPELSLPESSNWSRNKNIYADIRVQAIRSSSVCVFATGKALNYSIHHDDVGTPTYGARGQSIGAGGNRDSIVFKISLKAPRANRPLPGWNESWFDSPAGKNAQETDIYLIEDGYFGQTMPIGWIGDGDAMVSAFTTYIWGYFENRTMKHISAMTCSGKIQSVNTVTRFQIPSFEIPSNHPPIVDESSAKDVPEINGLWNIYPLDQLNWREGEDEYAPAERFSIDNIFSSLINGRYRIPKDFLRSSQYDARVQKAILRQDSIVKAQPLKKYARVAANKTLDDKPIFGNLSLPNNVRVLQDEASTRVLEAMLGLVLFFALLGSVLMNTDQILPKSPVSIAAVGSFLVDSNFLYLCDSKEENSNFELLRQCRVHLGWLEDKPLPESSSEVEKTKNDRYLTIYMRPEVADKNSEVVGPLQNSAQHHGAALEETWI